MQVLKQRGVWCVLGQERGLVESGVGRHNRGGKRGGWKDRQDTKEAKPVGHGEEFTLNPRMTPKSQCYSDSHSRSTHLSVPEAGLSSRGFTQR